MAPHLNTLFEKADRIVIVLEVFAIALTGVLLQIPKIKNSPASKMFTLVYRMGFIMVFANMSGIAWDVIQSLVKDEYREHPWMSTFIFFPILALCILMANWEYHYYPVGRGWSLFFLFYSKLAIILWTYLNEAIFTGKTGYYFDRLWRGSIGFFVLGGFTAVGHNIVQNGLKADYLIATEGKSEE